MTVDLGMPGAPAPVLAERRKTRQLQVGAVGVGSEHPISVQSMTTTNTADVNGTLQQIAELTAAGCDIVRVACPSADDAEALPAIAQKSQIPVIADIHFQPKYVFAAFPDLCLTAGDDSVTAEPCSGAPNQRWWDNPTDVPEWEQTFDNVRLDSDWLGGRLRRSGKVAGTGVYETPPPPKTWWIYWLLYERQDYGWSIERLSAGDNVVRIHSEDGDAWCLGSKDEHATDDTPAVLQTCDDDRGVAGAGQRSWPRPTRTAPCGSATRRTTCACSARTATGATPSCPRAAPSPHNAGTSCAPEPCRNEYRCAAVRAGEPRHLRGP